VGDDDKVRKAFAIESRLWKGNPESGESVSEVDLINCFHTTD
jgi:hypothetical protein